MAGESGRGPRGDAPDDGILSHLWRSVFRGQDEPARRPGSTPLPSRASAEHDKSDTEGAWGSRRPAAGDAGDAEAPPAVALEQEDLPIDSIIHLELTRVGDDDSVTPSLELLEIFPESPGEAARSGTQGEPEERPPDEGAAEETGEEIEARLAHPEAEERLAALRALRRRSDHAPVASVSARLRDPNPQVRSLAVSVLERVGGDGDLILLLDVMHDPSEEVRRSARRAILNRSSPSLVELLRRELDAPTRCEAAAELLAEMDEVETLVAAMAGQDPNIRRMIRHTLANTGLPRRLIRDLRHASPERRRLAAERLGTLRESEAVEELIRRLEDPDAEVRVKATKALESIGDAEAIRFLRQTLLADPETRVATAAAEALRRLTGGTPLD